jgi:hypothetical protein
MHRRCGRGIGAQFEIARSILHHHALPCVCPLAQSPSPAMRRSRSIRWPTRTPTPAFRVSTTAARSSLSSRSKASSASQARQEGCTSESRRISFDTRYSTLTAHCHARSIRRPVWRPNFQGKLRNFRPPLLPVSVPRPEGPRQSPSRQTPIQRQPRR